MLAVFSYCPFLLSVELKESELSKGNRTSGREVQKILMLFHNTRMSKSGQIDRRVGVGSAQRWAAWDGL